MSLAILFSRAQQGIAAPQVTVEVHLSNGLPGLSIVGLPETAVKESKERIRAALLNSHFDYPARRITINLAPADLPKQGGRYDLAMALGVLAASEQIPADEFSNYEFIGELALSGEIRSIRGILPAAIQARNAQRHIIIPEDNAQEASLISGITVFPAHHLLDVCAHFSKTQPLQGHRHHSHDTVVSDCAPDLADVHAQHHAKRALEIAAAGGHSLLMIGPPGTGKTMLASRLPGILPPMTEDEALETAAIISISQQGFSVKKWRQRPFRTPHHTASGIALVGGGSFPSPGEISLAHKVVPTSDISIDYLNPPVPSGPQTIH